MDTLWAPWRIEYIKQAKEPGCIFCTKPAQRQDKENFILYRGKTSFVIMNFYPYNNGHLMVVPFRHTSDITELNRDERLEMMDLLSACKEILKAAVSPHGFNIGMNLGEVAGAGVKDHLHFHIVPRWNGDTNYMPICGHTKVVSEGLMETWESLKKSFDKLNNNAANNQI
ncbi:HIT domain-containing protein [candidate division KSB1 bacterium]|nr:HIT domain-containing protein [candidate division KSB1 bacterium]